MGDHGLLLLGCHSPSDPSGMEPGITPSAALGALVCSQGVSCPSQLTQAIPPQMLGITQEGNRSPEPQPSI